MQGWIHTMVLVAIARILSQEQDSPYLGFCCRHQMEFQMKTLFSAIPSWWRVLFWSLSPPIPQILCEGFVVLRSCSYALWFPCRFSVVPRARQGYRLWVLMVWHPCKQIVQENLRISQMRQKSYAIVLLEFMYHLSGVSSSDAWAVFV